MGFHSAFKRLVTSSALRKMPSTRRSSKWLLSFSYAHQKLVRVSHLPHTCHTTRKFQVPDWITLQICEMYKPRTTSPRSVLHSSFTFFLPGPNIFLNIVLSKTVDLRSILNVSDLVSHPYKTLGAFIVV